MEKLIGNVNSGHNNRNTSAQFRIKPQVYVRRSSMGFTSGNWLWKIVFVAHGVSPININYSDFINRLNKVMLFS